MDDALRVRLLTMLRDDAVPSVRAEAARALSVAAARSSDVVDGLLDALEDDDGHVRRAATLSLGRVRHAKAVDALVDLLARRPELWEEVAAALATAGDQLAIGRLEELLAAADPNVRRGALRAIAAISSRHHGDEGDPLFIYTDADGHRHPLF